VPYNHNDPIDTLLLDELINSYLQYTETNQLKRPESSTFSIANVGKPKILAKLASYLTERMDKG